MTQQESLCPDTSLSLPAARPGRLGEVPGVGDVQYEPQSVEGPKGSFLPNGDGARFPELNDDSLFADHFFTVPAGVPEIGFTWTLTAPRRTLTWDYVMITADNTVLATFDSHNTTPPYVVEHIVPLGGFTGRHTVLGVWNIGDTPHAYYSAVDLLIEPGD
ncbi:lytic polysaccharide monooxygenase [Streptomyces rimosus]|uniref:lytic polysaccharide monooxygenase n=1 Tax=Streptomyces rimosus TaxID=1927 RepID=UPI00067C4057|nr:lytic polysaccharide monooxygenase [Streptomyces rimosus]